MTALPQPPPEALLIQAGREKLGWSYRRAAREAGMSAERWRQIEQGIARVARGVDVPVQDAPSDTIARMARAVNITAAELRSCGRDNAAVELEKILRTAPEAERDMHEELAEVKERLRRLEQDRFGDDGEEGKDEDDANCG